MANPGDLTTAELLALVKQALGGRNTGLMNDAWYTQRINSAYARLCTFQGVVQAPGMRRPQFRALRFFELYSDFDSTIGPTANNFSVAVQGASFGSVVYVDNIYDLTNDRPLARKAIRYMNARNPDDTGTPRIWSPGGSLQQVGYFYHPRPASDGSDTIAIRERSYNYPDLLLSNGVDPNIPGAWHKAIWLAAVSEAAQVIDWPEKAAEYEQLFMAFIAERRSPVEESGAAGGRRHFTIGGL